MKVTVEGLQPGSRYRVQARAVFKNKKSEWSPAFEFNTTDDVKALKVPVITFWGFIGKNLYATWTPVTENIDGDKRIITKYEIELKVPNEQPKYRTLNHNDADSQMEWLLTLDEQKGIWGSGRGMVTIRVRAVMHDGKKSAWSAEATAVNNPPGPVTNAKTKNIIDGIEVSWEPPVPPEEDIREYRVHVGLSPDFVPNFGNVVYRGQGLAFTYYSSTYVTHYFKIIVWDEYSLTSTEVTVEGKPISPFGADTDPPGMPQTVAVEHRRPSDSTASAYVTWAFDNALTFNADVAGFVVRWRKSGDESWHMNFTGKDARAVEIALPLPFADYEFEVAAFDWVANYSEYSPPVTANGAIPGPPPQVTSTSATPGRESVTIGWAASTALDVQYGGRYKVQLATDNAFTANLLEYQTGNVNITVSGLAEETQYYYRVAAIDVNDEQGPWSVTKDFETTGFRDVDFSDTVVPATPGTPTVTGGAGYLHVTWPRVTLNAQGAAQGDDIMYEVHVAATNDFTPSATTRAVETSGTQATVTKTGAGAALNYGTTYYVKIIARDDDGSSPASPQASGTPVKIQNSDVDITIEAGKITTGTMSASVFTLGTGGIIQSNNYDGNNGFSLTSNGLTIRSGTISAKAMESDSSFVNRLYIGAGGAIESTGYQTGTGFKLNSGGLDIKGSGNTISASALIAGTISSAVINVGAGGSLNVDATGNIKSNNYAAGNTGWKLDSSGLEINNGSIKADAFSGGTFNAGDITIASGGTIKSETWNGSSTGWQIAPTGITVYNGTIKGNTISTGAIVSSNIVGGNPAFNINLNGYAQFAGLQVFGNAVIGSADGGLSRIQSGNYVSGSAGWAMDTNGSVEFMNGRGRGTFYSSNGVVTVLMSTDAGQEGFQARREDIHHKVILDPSDNATPSNTRYGMGTGPKVKFKTAESQIAFIQMMGNNLHIRNNVGTSIHMAQDVFGFENGIIYAWEGLKVGEGQRVRSVDYGTRTVTGASSQFNHGLGFNPDLVIVSSYASGARTVAWNGGSGTDASVFTVNAYKGDGSAADPGTSTLFSYCMVKMI